MCHALSDKSFKKWLNDLTKRGARPSNPTAVWRYNIEGGVLLGTPLTRCKRVMEKEECMGCNLPFKKKKPWRAGRGTYVCNPWCLVYTGWHHYSHDLIDFD